MDTSTLDAARAAAQAYNDNLSPLRYNKEAVQLASVDYDSLLNLNGSGIMGYVEIPKLNVNLPIYHGTGEHYSLSSGALRKLQEYDWPGNIRELENVIQRALCFTSAGILQPEDLHIDAKTIQSHSEPACESTEKVSDYERFRQMQLDQERDFLIAKIRESNGSVREAAQKLGLFRTALYNRLSHLGVNVKEL